MKKTSCWILCCLFLFSLYPSITWGEDDPKLSPKGYEMSKKLNIDNPEKYWNKDFGEIDKDDDGYLSKEEFYEAFPKHGNTAFPYFDRSQDGYRWLNIGTCTSNTHNPNIDFSGIIGFYSNYFSQA